MRFIIDEPIITEDSCFVKIYAKKKQVNEITGYCNRHKHSLPSCYGW